LQRFPNQRGGVWGVAFAQLSVLMLLLKYINMKLKNRLLFFLILLLFAANLILLALFNKEKSKTASFSNFIAEANKNLNIISNSLAQRNFKKAHFSLIQTQKNLEDIVPLFKPPLPEKMVALSIPAGEVPYPFLYTNENTYLLLCQKTSKTLSLFRFAQGKFSLIKTYPCIIGMNDADKKEIGDYATPEGVYFLLNFIPGKEMDEKYGYGAFILNYPNLLDKKEKKKGSGIWLHGHKPTTNLNELLVTEGCVVISNDSLKELANFIKPSVTPMVIVDEIEFRTQKSQEEISGELQSFLNSWKEAWESLNTDKYLSFYAPEFVNSEGMNYETFKGYKKKVNRNKKFIRLKIKQEVILIPQKYQGKIAFLKFNQSYYSNNFTSDNQKLLYLKREKRGWQIIGESAL